MRRLITLCVLLAACSKSGPEERKAGPTVVRVQEARVEKVDRLVELTGTLAGAEDVVVAAEVEGRVEKVVKDLGDSVEAGGALIQLAAAELRLRADQAEAEYLQALAALGAEDGSLDSFEIEQASGVRSAAAEAADARRNAERGEDLRKRQLIADAEVEALRTRAVTAESQLAAAREQARAQKATALARRAAARIARLQARQTTITSPVPGQVARRQVSLGQYVQRGQAVAQVVIVDPLELRGEVPERYVGLIEPGMPVAVRVDSASGGTFVGQVSRVGPAVSQDSRTFPVEATFENARGLLRPGVFARAEIRVGADEELIAIPETAVSSVAGVTKVFVELDGKARERKVQVVRKRGSDGLVAGELRPGERVILSAIARMFEGAPVQVDTAAPPPGPPAEAAAPRGGG